MIKPIQILRLLKINKILMEHNFVSSVFGPKHWFFRLMGLFNPWYFKKRDGNRGVTIRKTLESLGPIYVKFGQMLSTRNDLVPLDVIKELQKLQDKVPPFPGQDAKAIIEKSLGKSVDLLFSEFSIEPLASASVAQVHAAQLHNGDKVVVKVIRPTIKKVIYQDIAVLYLVAELTEKLWSEGKRLHATDIVKEFEQTLVDELDLQREAANASQLKRNFKDAANLYVPNVYWDYITQNVMVMERISGTPLTNLDAIRQAGTNMKKLAEYGVQIFFTQVFRDSFFHADMHPGNMFIDTSDPEHPRYLGIDFGIMGTLSPDDQIYLAQNILAFFHRDYRKIAVLHIESGWIPCDTRVDQFESAIRSVCEPIFEKPINEISFGKLLLRLFQTAKRFNMEVQPQLMLLQKTLFNIESLGRQLYPELDLWATAKPFMENWIREQHSPKKLLGVSKDIWFSSAEKALKTPELIYDALHHIHFNNLRQKENPPIQKQMLRYTNWLWPIGISLIIISITNLIAFPALDKISWTEFGIGCALCLISIVRRRLSYKAFG